MHCIAEGAVRVVKVCTATAAANLLLLLLLLLLRLSLLTCYFYC